MVPEMFSALTTINAFVQPYVGVIMTLVGFIVYSVKNQLADLQKASQEHGEALASLQTSQENLQAEVNRMEERLFTAIMTQRGQTGRQGGD